MPTCYTTFFYLACVLGLIGLGLSLVPYVVVYVMPSAQQQEEGGTTASQTTTIPKDEGLPPAQGWSPFWSSPSNDETFVSTTGCNNSVRAVRRGKTLCYALNINKEEFVCLDDIVKHQTRLLEAYDTLPYVCTTMFWLHRPQDAVPCICSMKFAGIDGFYTIVQPRVQAVAEATEVILLNGAKSRLPLSVEVVNQYGSPYSTTAVFEGDRVPCVGQALLSIGIDIYQEE